jgi:acetyl esterase/lipase
MLNDRIYLKEYFPELGENGCDASIDYYIPECIFEKKKYPCMVVCPGGGYHMTSNREAEVVGMPFLAEGYRIVVVNYSVAPHHFPQMLLEVAGAMELIYKYAEEWHIDTNKISIMGFSAGGHLASQYSNRYNCPEVRALFPESKPVQASVLCYAVLSADPRYRHSGTIKQFVGHEDPIEENELGCSCDMIVSENTPPTFLWHTFEDATVPVECSLLYAKALSAHKVPFELHVYPYGPHGLSLADETVYENALPAKTAYVHQWIDSAKAWLKLIGF